MDVSASLSDNKTGSPSSGVRSESRWYGLVCAGLAHANPICNPSCLTVGYKYIHSIMNYLSVASCRVDKYSEKLKKPVVFSAFQSVYPIDCGHVAQNLHMMATAYDLGSCCLMGFVDDELNKLLELDGIIEHSMYMITVGFQREDYQKSKKFRILITFYHSEMNVIRQSICTFFFCFGTGSIPKIV